MENKYQTLKKIIEEAKQIVVFTGAGISVPSGIPDFRSAEGIYNQKTKFKVSPEEIISHSFFKRYPESFYEFYKQKMCYPKAEPNVAHRYFGNLEKKGKNVIVVTQNIDGLHQKGGSKKVYELHGTIHQNFCTKCGRLYDLDSILKAPSIPYCDQCGGIIKPNVVLYEESLDQNVISLAINAIMTSDVMIVIGTSLKVYPAAGFIRYFKGQHLVLINKEATPFDSMCNLVFNEDVVKVIEKINL
ncbi:MAG TPA: NAD-dependent protein deacylase [Erysipelotrichaceae bacterium]|nr:NAD-dependent protein deacylase [Erysipelotrichaceae bacterium]